LPKIRCLEKIPRKLEGILLAAEEICLFYGSHHGFVTKITNFNVTYISEKTI